MIGATTRFITAAAFTAGFTSVFCTLGTSATELLLTSGLEDNLGAAFVFSPCFVIELLDVSAFTLGFDVNFFETFALTVDFVWVFDFGLTLDFTAMTHILSLIIETPSASFLNDQFVPHKPA
jgi:hypothetical protein